MSLKCIAIDDEPMALEIITSFCQRYGNIELTTFNNPLRGMEQVRRSRPDILFLDIEMGDLNGVELARDLPPGTLLIFTTAYAQYALDGFELSAVDFLHKPFSYHRFEKAVQKAIELHKLQQLSAHPSFADESITLKAEYKNVQIKLKDILYIESMDNYVRIHLTERQSLMSQTSMKKVYRNFFLLKNSYAYTNPSLCRLTALQATPAKKSRSTTARRFLWEEVTVRI